MNVLIDGVAPRKDRQVQRDLTAPPGSSLSVLLAGGDVLPCHLALQSSETGHRTVTV